MWPGWHLALPSSTGLPVASGTPFVDRTHCVIVQCMYINKSPVGEESIFKSCFPTGGGWCFMSGMSVQTCLDRNAVLPHIVEYDVAWDASAVHLLDVCCESLADACGLSSILLCELVVSGSLGLEDEGCP